MLIVSKHMQLKRMNHSKLFLFFVFHSFASSFSTFSNITHKCSPKQSHALLLFKQNLFSINDTSYYECQSWLGSGYHPIVMNWNMSIDCCNWDGVTCNHSTGDVIALDLPCGKLHGTIHPNSTLFNLPHLQRLNLAYNDFYGSQLPREIGRLSNSLAHLNLSSCGLTGQVPTDITLLPKLVSLDLSFNYDDLRLEPHVFYNLLHNSTTLEELLLSDVNISSILPTYLNLSSSMKSLHLRYTGLLGKLPDNIFNLPYLEELDLAFNINLTDQLPKVNTNTSIPLKWLDLSSSGLSGEIPDSIGNLKSLNYLSLSRTSLSGEIPDSIGNLKSLNYLDLSSTSLSGEIPDSIGHLKSLNYLSLSNTGLSGEIHDSIGNLKSLNSLDLSYTDLSGEIPDSIGNLKSLDTLKLYKCGLMGPLPKSLFNLTHLTTLDLSSNMLNGTLPSGLFTLPSLISIDLRFNMLSGSLPSELFTQRSLKQLLLGYNQFDGMIDVLDQGSIRQTFQQLINLTALDLSNNKFRGVWELDTLLSSLTTLEDLSLSDSGFSVMINNVSRYVNHNIQFLWLASCKIKVFPESMRAMRKLQVLDLSRNEINGHIGEIGGNELNYLDLSHNNITGPFPPSIWNMDNLRYLNLSNNHFNGVIKPGDINFSPRVIDMGNNNFSGTIPHVCGGGLRGLILNGNQFEGEVPSCFSECRELEVLDLGNNRLKGTFPYQLGRLPYLKVLVLKSNKLYGPIESSLIMEHPFSSLRVLDLSQNEFGGHLPGKYFQNFDAMKNVVKDGTNAYVYLYYGNTFYSIIVAVKGQQLSFEKISEDFTIVDLSGNKFEGEIPKEICALNSLIVLNLSNNHLNGQIPYAIGNLSEIESLDLSSNQLSGKIPQSLADITNLEVLNLSQNHLVGRIPTGTQLSTFSASFGGNPGLCGPPLPTDCEHPSSPQPEEEADGDDEESGFTWKVVMLGYGCGTILGLLLGYVMLSTGRPKWFNAIADEIEHVVLRRQNKKRYIIYIGK